MPFFLSFFCAIEIFVRFFDYKNYFEAWTKSCSIEKPKTTSSHRNGSRVSSADQPNQRMTDHYEQQQQQPLRRMWNRNHLSGHFETITRTKLTTYSMLTDWLTNSPTDWVTKWVLTLSKTHTFQFRLGPTFSPSLRSLQTDWRTNRQTARPTDGYMDIWTDINVNIDINIESTAQLNLQEKVG